MSEDIDVLEDLVCDISWFEAVQTIRSLVGCSAKEAGYTARNIMYRCPNSELARSYFAQPDDSPSRKLFG